MKKLIQWLIFTNLYIAFAAVCFQLIFHYWSHTEEWNWMLSLHTFFATWLVYQLSRYSFHQNYIVTPEAQKDKIYQFVDQHPQFLKYSILFASIGTLVTVMYLSRFTLLCLGFLGVISLLYPIKIGGKSLRAIPFIKVFLIGLVWSGMAVWMPMVEINALSNWLLYLPFFMFQFLFILFITLPFDKKDVDVDQLTGVKTIPSIFGHRNVDRLIAALAIMLIVMSWYLFQDIGCFIALTALITYLTFFSIKSIHRIQKWQVMAIYDGSMVLFFLIVYLFYGI
jgi:4-hydroxybenzoate polyprenyltransferase